MTLTIGIPVRNSEWCLPYCFSSLGAQIIKPDEYVICIGPSNDKTEELVQRFVNDVNVPTKIIYDKDGIGTGYARKKIIETATQEYICWVDSDDILPTNWVKTILILIRKHRFDGLRVNNENYTEITLNEFLEKGAELPEDINITSLNTGIAKPRNLLVLKRDLIIQIGNYDPFFSRGQDADLVIRLDSIGIECLTCEDLHFFHLGVLQRYTKIFQQGVFFKFFYKYGFRNIFLGGMYAAIVLAFSVRSCVLITLLNVVISQVIGIPLTYPLAMFGLSLIVLFGGQNIRYISSGGIYKLFKPSLYIIQFGKCFGEYYTLYDILRFKNRKKMGYGKNIIRKRERGVEQT